MSNSGIVVITGSSSVIGQGIAVIPFKSAFATAKHGVVGLTRTIALKSAEIGVMVNAVFPGYVWTPLVEKQNPDTVKTHAITKERVIRHVPLAAQTTRKIATFEELSAIAVFICSDGMEAITGTTLPVDGGWTAHRWSKP